MSAPSVLQLAEEAEFQLTAARDQLEWFGAIARAIVRDVQHGGSQDVAILAQLAKFLDETGLSSVEHAINQFKAIAVDSAPQNANSEIVARNGEVRQ